MNLSKRYKRPLQQRGKYYRINYNITALSLRVLDEKNKQIGVFSKDEAIRRAKELGLDLVEIAPFAKPPVCKIIDFKKFRYLESKKERESKRKVKSVELKQVMLSPFIGSGDLLTKMKRSREFLTEGHRLKIIVRFKGRQFTKKQFGFDIINKFIKGLEDISAIDRPPHFEGNMLVCQLLPVKKNKNETQNQEIDKQEIPDDQDRKNDEKTAEQPPSANK